MVASGLNRFLIEVRHVPHYDIRGDIDEIIAARGLVAPSATDVGDGERVHAGALCESRPASQAFFRKRFEARPEADVPVPLPGVAVLHPTTIRSPVGWGGPFSGRSHRCRIRCSPLATRATPQSPSASVALSRPSLRLAVYESCKW